MSADARYRKLAWRWMRWRVFPSLEHASVPFGHDFRSVFDVGASRGQFALFALARFPRATVVAFEPLPQAHATAVKALAGLRAVVHNAALGATTHEATFHVSRADDSSSLLPIGARQTAEFPGTEAAAEISVPVAMLSAYLDQQVPRPVLLKLDVQGGELDVLIGAGSALGLVDEILVEASFVELYEGQARADEVIAYLLKQDFRLVDVIGLARGSDGEALQADLLFRRSDA
jgi:FkbM family methyltransferase